MKKTLLVLAVSLGWATGAWAKLPPLSDEAKAKAAEAAAKTAHAGKVDGYKLCKSMDQVAATYFDQAKKAGKTAAAPTQTAPCADPGPFVYPPPVTATAAGAPGAPVVASGAAPAAAVAAAGKAPAAAPAAAVAPKK